MEFGCCYFTICHGCHLTTNNLPTYAVLSILEGNVIMGTCVSFCNMNSDIYVCVHV